MTDLLTLLSPQIIVVGMVYAFILLKCAAAWPAKPSSVSKQA